MLSSEALVENGPSQLPLEKRDSPVVCSLSSRPQYICQATVSNYSSTRTSIPLISRPLSD